MEWFILWIIFSLLVGSAGSSRKIGFAGAFFLSIILSPLIGLIGVALSQRNGENSESSSSQQGRRMTESEEQKEYEHLEWLRNRGVLNEQEFKEKMDDLYRKSRK